MHYIIIVILAGMVGILNLHAADEKPEQKKVITIHRSKRYRQLPLSERQSQIAPGGAPFDSDSRLTGEKPVIDEDSSEDESSAIAPEEKKQSLLADIKISDGRTLVELLEAYEQAKENELSIPEETCRNVFEQLREKPEALTIFKAAYQEIQERRTQQQTRKRQCRGCCLCKK